METVTESARILELESRIRTLRRALAAIPCPPIYKAGTDKVARNNAYKCQYSSHPVGKAWGGLCPFHKALEE
jgi:hypothetical protein